MGFWKKALAVGETVAGVVTGNPALVVQGVGTFANDIQSESVKKANEQQQASTDKAQGVLDRTYTQTRQDYSPYQQIGANSLSTLSGLMGLPAIQANGGAPSNQVLQNGELGRMAQRDPNQTGNTALVPEKNYTGDTAVPRTLATLAGQSQGQSGYVTMMSPDGRTGRVPQSMVEQATAAGGRVVGGVS